MASVRHVIFSPGQIYHVFNRSVERRPIFTNKREYQRMLDLISYYRFTDLPMRYSQFVSLPDEKQKETRNTFQGIGKQEIILYAYALMPNHFHFLFKQVTPKGTATFLSNISNGFAKYFNIRHRRTGSLWQRPFKAVLVETDEQFLHLTRYIHLNPVSSFLIQEKAIDTYPWTSLPEYLNERSKGICDTSEVRDHFRKIGSYQSYIHDYIGYARELEKIKHLSLDGKDEQ